MRTNGKYILVDKKAVCCNELFEWAKWIEKNRKLMQVNLTKIKPGIEVSTVFLGLDHNFLLIYKDPILFETMVFGGKADGRMYRYFTWEEAEKGHKKVVAKVRKLEKEKVNGK